MFEQTFKNIDDVLWKEAGCATELDYAEQTSWMLFLKYLDDLERENEKRAELQGKKHTFILDKSHRWSAWAAPNHAGRFRANLRLISSRSRCDSGRARIVCRGRSSAWDFRPSTPMK